MNKNIVFIDWDGTLSWSRYWESLFKTNANLEKVVNDFFSFEEEMKSSWMRGKLKSEDVNKVISNRSGLPEMLLWQTFISDCQNMKVNPEALSLIEKLKEKYTVILVTGNMDCFSRFTVPALGLNKIFDRIINSSDVGYLKTDYDGKTFIDCFKQYNIADISKSYLLDDSEKTCVMFAGLGGKAMKVGNIGDTIRYIETILKNN